MTALSPNTIGSSMLPVHDNMVSIQLWSFTCPDRIFNLQNRQNVRVVYGLVGLGILLSLHSWERIRVTL